MTRRTVRQPGTAGTAREFESLQRDLARVRHHVSRLQAQVRAELQRTKQRLSRQAGDAAERARLAGMPCARLGSDSLVLEGPPERRLQVRRITVGEEVDVALGARRGVFTSATEDSRVQTFWETLQQPTASGHDDGLRGAASTVLDVPGAVVRLDTSRDLRVSMASDQAAAVRYDTLAVPKFTYDFSSRKLRNFGHWLLDYVPQVVALSATAPDAVYLLPSPLRGFQRATLELIGIRPDQMLAWDGSPVAGDRVVLFESDGRAGGRPLSALLEMHRRLATGAPAAGLRRTRRIYVSRRDAGPQRQWVSNEPEVEALFKARGFDVVVMDGCPLDDQVRMFRDAGVVAGVSGAGLADILFSSPDTHLILLLSDGLMHWYADQGGTRSGWVGGARDGRVSTLGDSPFFYVHLAAALGQHCHCYLGGNALPLVPLERFLDEALQRVEGA